jgi:hypothetical protein
MSRRIETYYHHYAQVQSLLEQWENVGGSSDPADTSYASELLAAAQVHATLARCAIAYALVPQPTQTELTHVSDLHEPCPACASNHTDPY